MLALRPVLPRGSSARSAATAAAGQTPLQMRSVLLAVMVLLVLMVLRVVGRCFAFASPTPVGVHVHVGVNAKCTAIS